MADMAIVGCAERVFQSSAESKFLSLDKLKYVTEFISTKLFKKSVDEEYDIRMMTLNSTTPSSQNQVLLRAAASLPVT